MSEQSYAPPKSQLSSSSEGLNELLIPLLATKPWVRFLSILGFIFVALMIIIALVLMLGGMAAGSALGGGAGMGIAGGLVGVLYIILAALYFFPCLYLHKYANAIGLAATTQSKIAIGEALTQQKSFWKFVGILTIIMLVLTILFPLLAGIIAGVSLSGAM